MRWNLIRFLQLIIVATSVLSCTGANIYQDLASNKESDAALYEDAQKLIDDGDYTGAIAKILSTTTAFQADTRVKESLAGAYAARCGMEFLPFVTNLTGGSSSGLFTLAMNGFVGVDTSNYADCEAAETLIEGIGAIDDRSQSQNLFLMILQLAKLGNRVRAVADISPTATGDGVVDGTFSCQSSVTTNDAKEIIESFSKFIIQFTKVGSVIGNVASIQASIDSLGGIVPTTFDYSDGSDANAADDGDAVIILARKIIDLQDLGLGSCDGSNMAACCP